MRNILVLTALAAAVAPALADASDAKGCPGMERGPVSPGDLDRFYVARAAAILKAAAAHDASSLSTLVSDEFDFEVWRGDVSMTGGKGVPAAIRLVELLRPRGYSADIAFAGPISVMSLDAECHHTVTLLVRMREDAMGARLQFDFAGGKLVNVSGNEVGLAEGTLD